MTTRIFPTWEQIEKLKTPLTEGERLLATFLDENLPNQWEIYLQPFFNGDHPDIVILHPEIGMVIYEVKDWKGNTYSSSYIQKPRNDHNKNKGYLEFYFTKKDGKTKIPNPINQVTRYRRKLLGLYQPDIGEAVNGNPKILLAFRTAVFFPYLDQNQIDTLFKGKERYTNVFGRDKLQKENLKLISPGVDLKQSIFMRKEWTKSLRFWLMPPFHSLEQGIKISLNEEQKRHVIPSPKKHQRLRGVVGSGKTLVIAQRAANLASDGKRVLIVSFNITLWHYIRDMISRARVNFDWNQIEFTHFHGLCSDFLDENDISFQFKDVSDDQLYNEILPKKVLKEKRSGRNNKFRSYDAILIDEGQDFNKTWYDTLCAFLSDNDEMLLVVDERQNIYDRNLKWIDNMTGTKFKGPWRELTNCYRLPHELIEKLNIFSEMFLGGEGTNPVPDTYQPKIFEPHLIWKNLDQEIQLIEVWKKVFQLLIFLTTKQNFHPQDIAILVHSNEIGWDLVQFLKEKKFEVNHVFEDKNHTHFNKKSFWMGDGRLKASTIHSFKGWEIRNLIVVTPKSNYPHFDKTLYTALTRMRENLIVFNRSPRYKNYGMLW